MGNQQQEIETKRQDIAPIAITFDQPIAANKSTDPQPPILPGESSRGLHEPAASIPCSVCRHEIPLSVALWRESSDYVAYFCGLECYDRWRNQSGGL